MEDEGPLSGSIWRDALWWLRFQRRRRISAQWRRACWAEAIRWSYDQRFEPYADWAEFVAAPQTPWGPEKWIILTRDWYGWPDPPQYAFFALGSAGDVICADDFTHWPSPWEQLREEIGCTNGICSQAS